MQHTMNSICIGQAGVHKLLAELIARGHAPYVPVVDTGVDVMLDTGLRLQVKTTLRPSTHWRHRESTFSFSLAKARVIRRSTVTKQEARTFSAGCDIVVLVALESNRFWIVPAPVLDRRHTVTISDGPPQWRSCDVESAKDLRLQGLTYTEVAARLGVDVATVQRRLVKGYASPKKRYANIPQYESRWDLLTEYGKVMVTANQTVNEPPTAATVDSDKLAAR